MNLSYHPKVCFILVNYNGEKNTIECVKSINNKLTYKNYEIIIVDNSPDYRSFSFLQECNLDNTQLVKSNQNRGFAAGCNIGILVAQEHMAEYVILLNNDTIIKTGNLVEELLKCFDQGNVGMAGGKILYFDYPEACWYEAGYISKIRLRAKNRSKIHNICETPFVTGCLQMVSMEAIKKVGLMDEDYFLCYEDADYCRRMQSAGLKILYNPNAVIYHKVSQSAIPSSPLSIYSSNRARYIFMMRFHKKNLFAHIDYWLELIIKKILYRGECKKAINNVIKFIREDCFSDVI